MTDKTKSSESRLFGKQKIGAMELKNRFVRSATWEGMASPDGAVTPPLIDIYKKLSKGGVGLIITGYAYVTLRGKANIGMLGAHDDAMIEGLKRLTDATHASGGAKIALQIAHGGSQSRCDTGLPTEAPSAVSERVTGNLPTLMSRKDIKRVINEFADAAERGKKAGFDAVQIHAAHGYLLSQFLSPYSNIRSDAYGGPIKKRARIIFEVYEAIRERVGKRFPIMIKINSSDFVDVGLTTEESLWVCRTLSKRGIDAIELSGGIPAAKTLAPARTKIDTIYKEAYFLEYAKKLKPEIDCPLILVGGIRSTEVMEKILDEGGVDLFSLSRPLISEPDLINRWESGDLERARCISCNKCLKAAHEEGRLYCVSFDKDKKANQPTKRPRPRWPY